MQLIRIVFMQNVHHDIVIDVDVVVVVVEVLRIMLLFSV